MPAILIIEKNCDIKSLKLKTFVEEDLYKKCNFKSATGFSKHATFCVGSGVSIDLYGKTEGRANHENKYEFPPPADNKLFFGSCILVKRGVSGEVVDMAAQDWEKYYSQFHGGGFDELGSNDSVSEDSDVDSDASFTKEGYEKDDFVVADDEPEPEPEPPKRGRKKNTTTAAAQPPPRQRATKKPRKTAAEISAELEAATAAAEAPETSIYDDEPELSEEEYLDFH